MKLQGRRTEAILRIIFAQFWWWFFYIFPIFFLLAYDIGIQGMYLLRKCFVLCTWCSNKVWQKFSRCKEKKNSSKLVYMLYMSIWRIFLTKDLKFKFSAYFRFLLKLAGIPYYLSFWIFNINFTIFSASSRRVRTTCTWIGSSWTRN